MKFKVKRTHPDAVIPTREYGNNGFDLVVVPDSGFTVSTSMSLPKSADQPVVKESRLQYTLKAGERHMFNTGLHIQLPEGHFAMLRPRSGNALRFGLHILGGLIDENYRGPWNVIVFNSGKSDVIIQPGDRIAQFVIIKDDDYVAEQVDELEDSVRGEKGFGSSGR